MSARATINLRLIDGRVWFGNSGLDASQRGDLRVACRDATWSFRLKIAHASIETASAIITELRAKGFEFDEKSGAVFALLETRAA